MLRLVPFLPRSVGFCPWPSVAAVAAPPLGGTSLLLAACQRPGDERAARRVENEERRAALAELMATAGHLGGAVAMVRHLEPARLADMTTANLQKVEQASSA
jgi:hypothetical protein